MTWLLKFYEPQGHIARWLEELSEYNLIVKHRAGVQHSNADVLSRIPYRVAALDIRLELNCGICPVVAARIVLGYSIFS